MQTLKKPTSRFPGKPQIRHLAKMGVVSGMLTRRIPFAYLPLTFAAYRMTTGRPGLFLAVCAMPEKERRLAGLPVRFSSFAKFACFEAQNWVVRL